MYASEPLSSLKAEWEPNEQAYTQIYVHPIENEGDVYWEDNYIKKTVHQWIVGCIAKKRKGKERQMRESCLQKVLWN